MRVGTGATDVTEDSVGNGRSADEVRELLKFYQEIHLMEG